MQLERCDDGERKSCQEGPGRNVGIYSRQESGSDCNAGGRLGTIASAI